MSLSVLRNGGELEGQSWAVPPPPGHVGRLAAPSPEVIVVMSQHHCSYLQVVWSDHVKTGRGGFVLLSRAAHFSCFSVAGGKLAGQGN